LKKNNPAQAIAKKALIEIRANISTPLKKLIKLNIKRGMPVHRAVKEAFKSAKVGPKLQGIVLEHTDKARKKV
jgi:hypothetical protein